MAETLPPSLGLGVRVETEACGSQIPHAGARWIRSIPPTWCLRPRSLRTWSGEGLLLLATSGSAGLGDPAHLGASVSLSVEGDNAHPSPRGLLGASWRFETGAALESSWDRQRAPPA